MESGEVAPRQEPDAYERQYQQNLFHLTSNEKSIERILDL